mgnify:CR=1 FL=1
MALEILIIVAFASFIQSIFGVGVLLLGTPLLILLGYNFFQALVVLLPISLLINLFQIIKYYSAIDLELYKKILMYTVPFIVIFLIFINKTKINIGIFIGVLLLLVASKDLSAKVNRIVNLLLQYEKSYLILMGILHGLTNLGGSLLTAIVHAKNYEKQITRSTIAAIYATFATFQLATLFFTGFEIDIKFSLIALCMVVGLVVFFSAEKIIYANIDAKAYRKYFAVFICLTGLLISIKSVY